MTSAAVAFRRRASSPTVNLIGNLHSDGLRLALHGDTAQTLRLGLLAGVAGLAPALAPLGDLLLLDRVVRADLFGSQAVIFSL